MMTENGLQLGAKHMILASIGAGGAVRIAEDSRIGMKDVFNPEPACWLSACSVDSKDARLCAAPDRNLLATIEDREDDAEW